jgi:Arc/MetJ-type ribon-helix-helix transcriptional regulator
MRRLSAVVTDEEFKRVDRLVRAGVARSVAELVRLAVKRYMADANANRLLTLRDIPLPTARRAVEHYLRTHAGVVWPDEMAEQLGIDYRIVLKVLSELHQNKKIEYPATKIEAIQV